LRTDEIYNTIKKLQRHSNSHLTDKDRNNLNDLFKDIRKYIQADWELYEYLKSYYVRKSEELKERDNQTKIEWDKITANDLKRAGLS
jgi:glucan phosphorylase